MNKFKQLALAFLSGNWWSGAFQEFDPAYAVFTFYDDGTTKRTMIKY